MHRLDDWRFFLPLAVALIVAGVFRSAWATRLDGFTVDEPWHVTAGVAYLRTGEYYLNPEHPPLVKLVAALAAPRSAFQFTKPSSLHDKTEERKFVEEIIYTHNDADKVQSRVRVVMYVFNGLLLLLFAAAAFRVFGGAIAIGALLFAIIDPTVAAHWPVVMTDLPVGLLSVASVLLSIEALRNWKWVNVGLLSIVLGLTLSAKHSGLIAFGFTGVLGLAAILWEFRREKRVMAWRICIFLLGFAGAVTILWGTYRFHYREGKGSGEKFNRTLALKIGDVRSPIWRASLSGLDKWRLLPRSYIWGLADIVRTGMEGRADSTYAFGRLTFMERRPLIFPGYIAVKLPIALTVLSCLGCAIAFWRGTSKPNKLAVSVLLALAVALLIILARSGADYAGVRHALTVYFVMAILAGFAVRYLLGAKVRSIGFATLGVSLAACFPALTAKRPMEYHNALVGGTGQAYRYFRNDGIDLGQRDKEIAEYCHRKLERTGEIPYLIYYKSLVKPDLVNYRHLKVKALDDPETDDLPPTTISGTVLALASAATPAMWSDYKALRDSQPVDRFGNMLVYRGTFYLPNARADALFDRANKLLGEPEPRFLEIENLLREGLVLRPNDFSAWMLLGNLHLLRGERELALAAYQKARDAVPPSPVRQLFEEQIRLVSTQPNFVTPMRDPGIE
jgi:dolichyl-phosphate-mannose-protein mannosyltransferase